MNWFLHNPVADLYGPYFLLFYTIAIAVVAVACYQSIRACDGSQEVDGPGVSPKLDPYEIAYLRGGENEVTRVAVASLIQRGLLEITDERSWLKRTKKITKARQPAPGEVSAIEATVLEWSGFPATPAEIFQPQGLAPIVRQACAAYESILEEEHLLAPEGDEGARPSACMVRRAARAGTGRLQAERRPRNRAQERHISLYPRSSGGDRGCDDLPDHAAHQPPR